MNVPGSVWQAFLIFVLLTSTVNAQAPPEKNSGLGEVVVRVTGVSPSVGITWLTGERSRIRLLGFFSTDFENLGSNNYYVLDFSYIRESNLIESESLESYWGIDLNILPQNPILAPGMLVGTTYHLDERFSLFGEIGMNVFIDPEEHYGFLGLHNTGVGVRLAL